MIEFKKSFSNNKNVVTTYFCSCYDHILICDRVKTKKIKLNIWLESENNNNLLSPILGQYNIKPMDFINEISTKIKDPFNIKHNLIIPITVTFIKNTYNLSFKEIYYTNIINIFFFKKTNVRFDILFFFKTFLYTKKKNFFNSLIRRMLRKRK